MKRWLPLILLLLLLAGYAPRTTTPVDMLWASVGGSRLDSPQAGEQFFFNIPVDAASTGPSATPIRIKVSGKVDTGSIRFELRRPDGQPVWDTGQIGPGDYSMATAYLPPAGQTGTYQLGLVYGANTAVLYNLSWHALTVSPLILLPGAGMLLVALAYILFAARRGYLGWRFVLLGALVWVVTVALKFAFAIPVNPLLFKALGVSATDIFAPANLLAYVYIGALTGVFEALVAWLILRKIRWGKATWPQAFVFGVGFGAFEAILLGLASLLPALAALTAPDALPVPTLAGLVKSGTLLTGLAPVVERFTVILAHIFACVLIFYAIARREAKWAWLAVLYKTVLDIPGGFAAYWGVETPAKLWTIEAVIALTALAGLWGILWVARRYPGPEPA